MTLPKIPTILTPTNDIVTFANEFFVVNSTLVPLSNGTWKEVRKKPLFLLDWQKTILRDVFPPEMDGIPRYRNYLYSAPKKFLKSTTAALAVAFTACRETDREIYICAADRDQAKDRIFAALKYAIEYGPLSKFCRVLTDKIYFEKTGCMVQAFPMDYKGAAGGVPILVVFDELHTYVHENMRRLWDEMVPPPSLDTALRWVASYAGWVGESELLRECWDKVEMGLPIIDLLDGIYDVEGTAYVYHSEEAGWGGTIIQDRSTYKMLPWMRDPRRWKRLNNEINAERPVSAMRLYDNRWAQGLNPFIAVEMWEACMDITSSELAPTKEFPIDIGVDAATKSGGDDAAVIGVYRDKDGNTRVAFYRLWAGGRRRKGEIRIEETVEPYILEMSRLYKVRNVLYDPRYMTTCANHLKDAGIHCTEIPQTSPTLGALGMHLHSLIRDNKIRFWYDETLKKLPLGANAKEVPGGIHIIKGAGKCDLLMALSFACKDMGKTVFGWARGAGE